MPPENTITPCRIAIRERAAYLEVYLARPDTMTDALFLGCFHKSITTFPVIHEAFIKLVQDYASEVLQEVIGQKPTFERDWDPHRRMRGKG